MTTFFTAPLRTEPEREHRLPDNRMDEPFGGWPRRMPRGRMRVDKFSAGVFSMLDLILIVCTLVIFYAFDRYTVSLEHL